MIFFEIQRLQQIVGAVTAARAYDRAHVVAYEHLFHFARPAFDRSGEVKILFQNRIEIERDVSRSAQCLAAGLQFSPLDVAGGRNDAHRIAGAKGGRFDGLTGWRSDEDIGCKAVATSQTCGDQAAVGSTQLGSTQKEFSPAQQPRRTRKKTLLPVGADGLRSAGSLDLHRRNCPARCHRRHCRGAGTGAGRLRLTDPALKEARSHVVLAVDRDQFNIHALLEMRVALDFRRPRLPVRSKLRNERRRNADCPSTQECRALPVRTSRANLQRRVRFRLTASPISISNSYSESRREVSWQIFMPAPVRIEIRSLSELRRRRRPRRNACRCRKSQPQSRRR